MSTEDNSKEFKLGKNIVEKLNSNGFLGYFAGGYIRDKILGRKSSDIDIATDATPNDIARIFRNTISVGEHFGVMVVVKNRIQFEVATFRTDAESSDGRHPDFVNYSSPEADAQRRDFTINGIFYDPVNNEVIDYVNGIADIEKKIIRTIGNPVQRFGEDYLRLLRGIRFSAEFSFAIEENTWDALVKNSSNISNISVERIFQELTKMFTGSNPVNAVKLLDESGLLKILLPEVYALKGVEQPPQFHPEGDVFTHTLLTLGEIRNRHPATVWSALLHDIGKPKTMTVTDRIRFNNHHRVGANMARKILTRFKCSNRFIEDVYNCVDGHMNFMNVTNMRLSTLKKFLSRDTIEDELELHVADCKASHGDISNFHFIKDKLSNFEEEKLKPKPLISGKDLISLNLKPGPKFGEIISYIYDLQLEEKLSTKYEAIGIVKEKFIQNH